MSKTKERTVQDTEKHFNACLNYIHGAAWLDAGSILTPPSVCVFKILNP